MKTIAEIPVYNIYRNLVNHALKSRDPIYMVIELTYRCNYHCPFCYVDHDATSFELDVDTWMQIFQDIKSAGCINILVTGGEPLLHKGCIRLLHDLKELGFLTTLFTNGSLIQRETALELAKLNLGEIGITLYGADAKTHDSYTRNPGSFECVMNAIKIMKDLGCNIQLKWNAISGLVEQTGAFIDIAEDLGVGWHANGVISVGEDGHCEGRVSDDELRVFYLTLITRSQTLQENVAEAETVSLNWQREVDPEARMCAVGQISGRINPEGILYPCIDIHEPVGDLTKESFSYLWNKSPVWNKFLSMKRKNFPHCSECKYFNVCKYICPGTFKNETGSYYGVSSESCRNTQLYIYAMNQYLNKRVGTDRNPINKFVEVAYGL